MSQSQYPEPPNPNQAHYTPIYPAPPAQMVDEDVKQPIPLSSPRGQQQQHFYPELAPSITDPALQHHANIEDRVNAALSQHSAQQQQEQQAQAQAQARQAAQQAVQQLQQHQQPSQTGLIAQPDGATPQKSNRLRKACDSCSIRKVKCDESGPPCRACAQLDIPCTFERPSRRRGPPNRHAEAIKKRRLEESSGLHPDSPSSPAGQAVQALAALSASHGAGIEQILPHDVITLLINDFFTYIHPLCPFPHEPTFRNQWADRLDQRDPRFLALLASMLGALVASFPRKPRLHLKMQRRDAQYSTHMSLVHKCLEVAVDSRGTRYLLHPNDLTVYDACTSYYLGLCGAYTYNWRQCRLHFGECLNMMRALGIHHAKDHTSLGMLGQGDARVESMPRSVDKITEQVSRRLFWTAFVGMKSLQQAGANFGEITIPPATPAEPYPPLPVEVDDEYMTRDEIGSQPVGIIPLMTGFNINCRVYSSYGPVASMEMAYGAGEIYDWDRQKALVEQCLHASKSVLDDLPTELRVEPAEGQFGQSTESYYPPLPEYANQRNLQSNGPFDFDQSSEERRKMQYEIEKANIYASYLSTRSHLVEKYFNLRDAHERKKFQKGLSQSPAVVSSGFDSVMSGATDYDETDNEMAAERERVVKDLMTVLGSINQVNMEPNGDSFTTKIRQVASTLLEVPQTRKGSVALSAEEYLVQFLAILSKLERNSPSTTGGSSVGGQDEDSELKAWADLREYQLKFQQSGGYIGEAS